MTKTEDGFDLALSRRRLLAAAGLHLQFGADASSQVVVSWHTLQPVRPRRD
jgi:hypothetical protein